MKHIRLFFLFAALVCATAVMAQADKYPYNKATCPYYDPDNNKPDFTIERPSKADVFDYDGYTYGIKYWSILSGYEYYSDNPICNGFSYVKTPVTEPNQVLYVPGIVNISNPESKYVKEVKCVYAGDICESSDNFTKLIFPRQTENMICQGINSENVESKFIKDMIVNSRDMKILHKKIVWFEIMGEHTHYIYIFYPMEKHFVNLEMVTFTPSVEVIDYNIIYNAKKLNALVLNAPKVKMRDGNLFVNCDVLKKVFIGPEVVTMPKGMYSNLGGINTVKWDAERFAGWKDSDRTALFKSSIDLIMGDKVEAIGQNTFYGCKINSVCAKDLQAWMQIKFDGRLSNPLMAGGTLKLLKQGGNIGDASDYLDLPDKTLDLTGYAGEIGNYQFCGGNFEKIVIPESVTKYGDEFLSGCTNLKEIRINGIPHVENMNALNGLARENVTIMLDSKEIWKACYDLPFFRGFIMKYVGMPESEMGQKVTIPHTGMTFAKFDQNVAVPAGVKAYYACGQTTTVTYRQKQYDTVVGRRFNAQCEEAIPANTVVIITGAAGDYYFMGSDLYAQSITSALKYGGKGGTGVYKYDPNTEFPRFEKTTKGEDIPANCVTFTPTDCAGNYPDYIYFMHLPHDHSYDANGFCTDVNDDGVHCQAVQEPAKGDDGYYQIELPGHMQWLAHHCAGDASIKARLMNDIDFTDVPQQVIVGTEAKPYIGEFDGAGHTITLNLTGTSPEYAGVFGYVGNGGYIHHLNVSGLINRSYATIVGSVVGALVCGKVSCCTSDAELRGAAQSGGIVGVAYKGTVENCAFTGRFTYGSLPYGIIEMAVGTTITSCYVASDGVDAVCGGDANVQNCYVKNDETADAFANGEICWLLNGSEAGEDPVWRQTIGINDYPVLDAAEAIVIKTTPTSLNSIIRPSAGAIEGATAVYNFAGIKGSSVYGIKYTEPLLAGEHPYIFTTDKDYVNFVSFSQYVFDQTETCGLTGVLIDEGEMVYGKDNYEGDGVSIIFTANALKYANPKGNLVKYGKCYIDAAYGIIPEVSPMACRLAPAFEDGMSGVEDVSVETEAEGETYNIQGIPVGDNYKGIIIQNGRKLLRR